MTSPDEPAAGKVCTKCGEWKPWVGFARSKRDAERGGAGYNAWCKLCMREYREANRDRIADQQFAYRESRRALLAQKQREYVSRNREAITSKKREYQKSSTVYRVYQASYQRFRRARKRSLPSETVLLREIALRDGATCWICGDELSEWNPAHLDHLVPLNASVEFLEAWNLSNPGTVRANMALACPTCNIRKSNRLMPCALARYFRNLSAESELAA